MHFLRRSTSIHTLPPRPLLLPPHFHTQTPSRVHAATAMGLPSKVVHTQGQSCDARPSNPPLLPQQQLLVSLGDFLLQFDNLSIHLKQVQTGAIQFHSAFNLQLAHTHVRTYICTDDAKLYVHMYAYARTTAPFLSSSVSSWLCAMYRSSLSLNFFSSEATFMVATESSTVDPPSVPTGEEDITLGQKGEDGGRREEGEGTEE